MDWLALVRLHWPNSQAVAHGGPRSGSDAKAGTVNAHHSQSVFPTIVSFSGRAESSMRRENGDTAFPANAPLVSMSINSRADTGAPTANYAVSSTESCAPAGPMVEVA